MTWPTDERIDATLRIELGNRAWSWLSDVNPYEFEPEAYDFIPGLKTPNA